MRKIKLKNVLRFAPNNVLHFTPTLIFKNYYYDLKNNIGLTFTTVISLKS